MSLRRALYGKMAGDTTLTNMLGSPAPNHSQSIYYQQRPKEAQYPCVVFSRSSGVPTDTLTEPGAYETDVWLVKGVGSADDAEAIQKRLKELLNDADLSISGYGLMLLRRQSDQDYPEVVGSETYRHAGSLFRVVYQPQ